MTARIFLSLLVLALMAAAGSFGTAPASAGKLTNTTYTQAQGSARNAAPQNPTGTGLVISQIYGGGGNSGSTLKNDFIELFNPTAASITFSSWSVQYASAGGSFTSG